MRLEYGGELESNKLNYDGVLSSTVALVAART